MSLNEKKYSLSLDGVVYDLSQNSIIDTVNSGILNVGSTTYTSRNGNYAFVSTKTSTDSAGFGDIFVYSFNVLTQSWSYQTSLYNLIETDISNHNTSYGLKFGSSIVANDDASTLFVGIPGYRTSNLSHGGVCVFNRSGSTWSLHSIIGTEIGGNIELGTALTCSKDGTTMFTSTGVVTSSSNVYKYDLENSSYSRDTGFSIKPSNITSNSNYGSSLDCNDDATVLVIGSDTFDTNDNTDGFYFPGAAHIVTYNNSSWSIIQDLREDICNNYIIPNTNTLNSGKIGRSVQISSDGSKVCVSTALNVSSKYGIVFYFELNNTSGLYEFKQQINPTSFNTLTNQFGHAIAMSKNGNYLVISTLNKNIDIYNYDSTSYWVLNQNVYLTSIGSSIVDYLDSSSNEFENSSVLNGFGSSVSTTDDGVFISIGIPEYKYDDPNAASYSSIIKTGQAFILKGKSLQSITFNNFTQTYGLEYNLGATSNSSSTPQYSIPNTTSSIYSLDAINNKVTIIGSGNDTIDVTFAEDNDYLETSKQAIITGVNEQLVIDYTESISTQGTIGVGQTSGLIFSVVNQSNNSSSSFNATVTISGGSITYDSTQNIVTGVSIGVSTLTLTSVGDTNHNTATPVILTYDVSNVWSSPYPGTSYIPSSTGLDITSVDPGFQGSVVSAPDVNDINNIIGLGLVSNSSNPNNKIFSIPLSHGGYKDDLTRTNFQRDGNIFSMKITQLSEVIDYIAVSLKAKEEVSNIIGITSESIDLINGIQNATDIIQIEKYIDVGADVYEKETNEYVNVRIYHPHDTLVLYHIDDNGVLLEVNTDNFAGSLVTQDDNDSNYWNVKMQFSSIIGGTGTSGTTTSNTSGDPHIFPVYGSMYELPPKKTTYRMLQGDNLIVNASTRYVTEEEGEDIIRYYENVTKTKAPTNIVTKGVFYNALYIESDGEKLYYNYDSKKGVTSSSEYFKITKSMKIDNKFKYSRGTMNVSNIHFNHSEYGNINIQIQQYANPQIKNGIQITCDNSCYLSGLCIREYKTTSMETECLNDSKHYVGIQGTNKVFSKF